MSYGPTSKMLLYEDPFCKAATILAGRPFVIVVKVVKVNINVMKTRTTFHELIMSLPNATRQGKFYFNTGAGTYTLGMFTIGCFPPRIFTPWMISYAVILL